MPDQNAYDSLLQSDTAQRVRVSMMDAVDKQPDTEAKLQGLAKAYGMPVDAVRLRQPEIERQARLDALDYDTLANRYPKTANVLANPNAAAIAHDDVDNMSGLERAARGLFGGAVEGLGMLASGAGVGLNILQRNLTQAAGALLPTPRGGPMTEGALDSLNGSLMGEDWKYVGGLTKRTARQDIMVPEAQRTFTDQVLGGLGQIGVQIPASIFLGPAPLYLQGLDAMDEKVSKDNAPQWKKDLATVGGAAITGITEKWALDHVLGPAAEPVKNALAAALARIGIAAASEGGQEFSENLLQDLLRKGVTNPDAPVQIGDSVQEGAVGATVGGIVRSIIESALHVRARGARSEQQAQQAEAHAQVLGELAKLAEASKVRERDPAQFAQFMQSVVEEGVPHLYVNANALAKSVDLNQVAMALPSVAEQITQAMATGGDLVIPTAEFLTAGPGNEFMQTLIDHARTSVDAPSPAQGREYMQEHGDQLRQDIDKVLAEREQDQAWQASHDAVRDEFKAQLGSAKRFTADVNAQYANLPANFYSVTAAKLGVTPQELAQRYGLRVQAKEVQGGQQLDQAGVREWADRETAPPGTWVKADYKLADSQPVYQVRELNPADLYLPELDSEGRLQPEKRKYLDGYVERAKAGETPPSISVIEMEDGRLRVVDGHRRALAAMAAGKKIRALVSTLVQTAQGKQEATVENIGKVLQQSALPETIEIDGKQRPTTNSNGQPIAATEEGVRNFWKWFGDSKMVDAEGRPLVVYHGTTKDFQSFDPSQANDRMYSGGTEDTVFLTDNPDVGASYAGRRTSTTGLNATFAEGGNVLPVYLKITKPLKANAKGESWRDVQYKGEFYSTAELTEVAKSAKKDGMVVSRVMDYRDSGVTGDNTKKPSTTYAVFSSTQIKSAIGNSGEFDPANPSILRQEARGSITLPTDITKSPAIISLFKGANLSTFIHEMGHFFLEVQADLAARIQARIDAGEDVTPGERGIVDDTNILLAWLGVKGSGNMTPLDEWHSLDIEAKRPMHEQWARGFEAYSFEGNAPSIELQSMFQKFRAWLVSVYKDLKALNVTLTDDVRGVMDRMLASTQAIQEAEAARRMGPLFKTAEEAGMSLDEFAAYHALATDATQAAVNELQARGLRDMRWLANAKDKKLKELQAQYKTLRSGVRKEIRAEVMSQPVYRAWQFLTGKGDAQETAQPDAKVKQDPKALDVVEDSLFKAIAKLGGLSKDEAVSLWGVDPKEKIESGVFGAPVLRKSGGLSVDAMAARLTEVGYLLPDENGAHDVNALFEAFDSERRGLPVYSTWHEYQRPNDGAPVEPLPDYIAFGKLNTGALTEQYGTKEGGPLAKLQALKMTSEARGIHPDVVAETFGFSSGDEMVKALLDAEPPASAIEGMTDQRMLERYGDLGTLEGLTKAADRAIHNEARARFVATEIKALETGMRVRAPGATGKSTVDVLATVARQQAEAIVARTKVRDLRPGQYTAAEARAARAAEKAMLAGKTEDALAEKRHQIINLQAAKATMKAQDEMDRTIKYLRKFDKATTRANVPADYLAQIDMLLEKFDLRGVSGAEIDRTVALRTWVQSRLAAGEIPVISDTLLTRAERTAYEAAINARDDQGNLAYPDDEERIKLLAEAVERSAMRAYKDMTVEEMRGLRDTIKQIEHLAKLKNKMLTAKDGRTYEATRDALVTTIKANAKQSGKNTRTDNTLVGGWLESVKQFGASHIKVATWLRIFDGGQDGGAWWNTVLRPANERASFEATRRADATARLMDILGPVLKNVGLIARIGKGRSFPELGTSLNWEERFTIACNYGNESNLQRLMGGGIAGVTESLTMQQVQTVLRSLTATEWRAVQGVWDHFETYRPEIAAKELRVNGIEPEWIAARPFDIQTADGQTLSLRGGYYPVVFDPKTSMKAQQHNDAQAAKDAMRAAYSAATTQRSFTKARVEEVTGRPLLLNLRGLYSGTNDVIHDLAWHEWVIDMNKLMRSHAIDEAIREHYGANVKKELTKWRDDIVAGSKKLDHGIENAAGWARKFTSSAALTYNVMSAVLQPLGITQSFSRVGTTWVAKGIGQYLLAGPVEATRMVQGKSEFMANRTRTMFRDLNELRNRVEGQTAARELMGRYGYFATMHMQMVVDVPTWIGGYEKAIAAGHDEDTAIALADQGVKDSQGGGEEVDQAGITRGGPLVKLFTAFYEFMNTQANVLYLANATSKTKADAFMHFALVGLATPILAAAVKAALTPGDSGDWDEEHVFRTMLREGLANLFGMVAFGREFTGLVDKMLGTNKGVSYSGPTGLRIIPDTIKLGEQAAQGDLDDAFRKSFLNVLGDFSGIPAVQINRTITGAEALSEGETQNPGALVFGYQKP